LNSECQADGCEHVNQGVKAELADLSVQEIRNSPLVHVKTRYGFSLCPTFFADSLLDEWLAIECLPRSTRSASRLG
jgi:hypothetical protein